jgi:Mlc titration factor MtfA (ptsG expression regulator)
VATESFFVSPQELQCSHSELYAELKWYYRQDPARWLPAQQTN